MLKAYLDSSAMVKRYIFEPTSPAVDRVFDEGWAGEVSIATSIWNIGEVLGVLDERRRRRWLNEDEFEEALRSFAGETTRLARLKILEIFPASTSILIEAWPLILSEHIYEADALQIRTCIHAGSDVLISADRELINVALRVGLKAVDTENEDRLKELLKHTRS